jgi:serine/threonine-protein kinase HipA
MKKCLYCYQFIGDEELATDAGTQGYHRRCSQRFFGRPEPPRIDFTAEDILALAEQVIKSQRSVTGVQPKLSLDIAKEKDRPDKLTIVGLWGQYILKPQSEVYPNLPENEDLTMHLAALSDIRTVEHSLIRLRSGELAYITRTVDRDGQQKYHMEDMCQLTERLTEHKYKGSHEQIAKAIRKFSANPGLDMVNFHELVLFCFLTGNNDMHLKNFSLLKTQGAYNLCPAYDLVASRLVLQGDDEELALSLNGKKNKLGAVDFISAMKGVGMDDKVIENLLAKYVPLVPKWYEFINQSFLPDTLRDAYKALIDSKLKQLISQR